ncbi:hypothetical protein NHX12_011676 [Muraenolepis orangiensis]|uniref:Rab11 family-interacting protein 5 n=1 Tax=Muraenolepis orangiensis TaxID=630683 RepID=A0A9Q0DGW9_9TELE|nr:hypothetical protein NHX12_011676 [Muraenolepis orangiensis]
MMSLIDLDDDQRWVPTHVNVTVLRARGLRTKGKHGSRYLYTIIQVAKEKFTTGLVERAAVPEWNEECCFELLPGILEEGGRSAYPSGSGDLVIAVMHRVLIGLDVFLGQVTIPLDGMFHDGMCPRDEWMKLNSKAGRKEKERGEVQVTVQFTRNNMTASMFDLTMKDTPRSAFGKLKDRVTGRKRGDVESSSAILPGRYAALSGNIGQPPGEGGGVVSGDAEVVEEKRSKVKDFFKGKLRRSADTRSCSSLASESSASSMASDHLGPPPSLDLLADPPSSPIYTSKVRVDTLYGETDLAKKVLTSQHTSKVLTHKRAFSDEASVAGTAPAVEALKGQTMTQSKSSLCINGSHVYDSEPSSPRSSAALQSKLVLLEKCSPLSRSLQNLTKRSDSLTSPGEGRRWSFDKTATPIVSSAAVAPDKGKKQKKALFSGGRSDSLPAKSDHSQAVEGRLRGWFGSADPTQNKPRLEASPKEVTEDPSTPAGPPNSLPGAWCLSVPPLRTLPSTRSNSTLAVAPFTSPSSTFTSPSSTFTSPSSTFTSPSSTFSSPSTTIQPLIDAPHTLLPEEIDPACNLPRQESSPHPVKPLNSTASQSDKKDGRSVLEKLKSTIHPGRTASQSASESERSQLASVDTSAQYQQLSNMELIALLLQQEMDMQKQQTASEQQGALLDKREAELKKLKTQVRDLEDYIDNLLLRIMEQTPTLLQVRARHK